METRGRGDAGTRGRGDAERYFHSLAIAANTHRAKAASDRAAAAQIVNSSGNRCSRAH
ncbi:MAG: hypothetical protein LDL41_17490 [Coleofasciculus sp. S288]|nr:hypothetical protein [Coleofasciculus sp. S288]